jgi:hypothetical protein
MYFIVGIIFCLSSFNVFGLTFIDFDKSEKELFIPHIDFTQLNNDLLSSNNNWSGINYFNNVLYASMFCYLNNTCFDFSDNMTYITNNITNNYGNSSWNQALADSLYAPIGSNVSVSSDNTWINNSYFIFINSSKPQAINVTKTCLSGDCGNYQLVEKNDSGVYLSWY